MSLLCLGRSRFNPTMVRLRLAPGICDVIRLPAFQSHYGAIATSAFSKCPLAVAISFNPTMVRLRLDKSTPPTYDCIRFNPTMVRLRPLVGLVHDGLYLVSIPLWCDCDRRGPVGKYEPFVVSIPLWCDCDQHRNLPKPNAPSFQSHYGAIATNRRREKTSES
jgi:hypothetical protein